MLEIIFLVAFGKHLSEKARAKGRSGWLAALGVAGWIMGEFIGMCFGIVATGDELAGYCVALCFAAVGASIAWAIVHLLPPVEGFEDYATVGALGGLGTVCPKCRSVQTEVAGGVIQCFNCGELSDM